MMIAVSAVHATLCFSEWEIAMSRVSLALDNLRGFVVLMALAFHSFMAYMASQPLSPSPFDARRTQSSTPIDGWALTCSVHSSFFT